MFSHVFTCVHLFPLVSTCFHLFPLVSTCVHFGSLVFFTCCLHLFSFTCCLHLVCFTCFSQQIFDGPRTLENEKPTRTATHRRPNSLGGLLLLCPCVSVIRGQYCCPFCHDCPIFCLFWLGFCNATVCYPPMSGKSHYLKDRETHHFQRFPSKSKSK